MALTGIDPTFINSPTEADPPTYDAEELRRDFAGLLAAGNTASSGRGGVLDPRGLVVSLAGSTINVSAGPAAVESIRGSYLTGVAAPGAVDTLVPADATNARRDRVVLMVRDTDNPESSAPGRDSRVVYLPGTPSPSAFTGGGMQALPAMAEDLAWIDVPRSGLGSPAVTDKRRFSVAAGAPVPVASVIEMNALPKYQDALCYRRDLNAVLYCNGTSWAPLKTDGGQALAPVNTAQAVNYTFSGVINVTNLTDGRKRVELNFSMARKTGAPTNNMSGTSQAMGAVIPTGAQGAANSIMLACPLDNGVSGNVSTTQVFVMISPSSGNMFIWAPVAFGWVAERAISINATYYIS